MAEYIDRATALEALKNAAEYYSRVDDCTEHTILQCVSTLQEIPAADVVEVVRCGECIHFDWCAMECENDAVSTDHEGGASYSLNFGPDDFCSFGKRREEE